MEFKKITLALFVFVLVSAVRCSEDESDDAQQEMTESKIEIPTVKLRSGYEMPMLGLGTARLATNTMETVKEALKLGYRLIDTAKSYTVTNAIGSEQVIGKAIEDSGIPREEIFIITKIMPEYFSKRTSRKAIEQSLNYLRTNYIDLVLLHTPSCFEDPTCKSTGTYVEGWKNLEILVDEGKIRSLGVSNCIKEEIENINKIATHPITLLQNWFDPYYQEKSMRVDCSIMDIVYMGYSTLGAGWMDDGMETNPVLADSVLQKIAEKHGRPVSDIVLRWAVQSKVAVIPGSSKSDRLSINLNSQNFQLDDEDMRKIDDLDEKLTPSWGDSEGIGGDTTSGGIITKIINIVKGWFGYMKATEQYSDEL